MDGNSAIKMREIMNETKEVALVRIAFTKDLVESMNSDNWESLKELTLKWIDRTKESINNLN